MAAVGDSVVWSREPEPDDRVPPAARHSGNFTTLTPTTDLTPSPRVTGLISVVLIFTQKVSNEWYIWDDNHWNRNVILMKFSPLAALEIVQMTTLNAASGDNFVKMTFQF